MKKNSFCALLILIGALQQCAADGLNQWTPNTWSVSSVNSLGDVWGVAYGDGIYLEAGDRNVATSTTGTQWTASTNIITANNAAVVFKSVAVSSSGVFVLVGTYGTIFSSADGLAWTPQTSPNDNHIYGVTWGNGSFVAVGQNASIITSTDGVTWNSISTPRGGDLLCVTYANGLFVAGATNGLLYTSPNGSAWTQSGSSSDAIYGLAYGGGTFVGVGSSGSVVTSGNNGVSWTQNKVAGVDSLNGVTFADGVFVADGDEGLVATSPDGVNWSTDFNNFGIQDEVYESASFANGKVFLAGDLGTNVVLDWPNDLNGVTSGKGMQVAVGGQGLIVSSTGGSAWARQVSGTANTLHAVAAGLASGGFTFLAVGDAGTVTTSANGTAWTAGSTGTANDLYAVAYTVNNTFVAVGAAGSIYTSSDGSTWAAQTSGTSVTLRGIGYDSTYGTPGELVAVGDNGTILTSSDDGVTWVAQKSEDTATLYAALYAASQGLFVSVGDSSGDDLMVQTSQDATNWATQGTGPYPIHAVTFGDQIFVTVGEQGTIQASPDGTNWTGRASPTTSGLYGVTLANNSFLAVGQLGTIINSGPVLPFASLTSGTSSTLTGFAMGNGATSSNLVAVGAGGTIVTSDDGTTFAPVASSTTSGLSAVIFAGGQYVAVGASGAIITSPDGNVWAAAASGVTAGLTGVAYGDGNYVAVGGNSTVLTSSDGVTWTPAVVSQTENIVSVSFGNGVFVALDSDGTILTSPNGTTWTLNSPGLLTPLVSITFANGTFLGTDAYGGIYSSVDGVDWSYDFSLPPGSYSSVDYFNGELAAVGAGGSIISTPLQLGTPPSSTDLYAVTYGNGLYVAVGDSGTILTSEDGNNWIAPSAYAGTANYLDGITYGDGTYIGVGNNGWTVTSPDGVNWTSINSGATANVLTGITFGDGQFVAVGIAGTIIDFSNSSGWTVSSYAASATDTNDSFDGVAYGNGQFVAVGNDSTTTFSSPTGATWTQGGGGYYADYSDGIAYGNGIFVGVASDGEIYTSTDGANWTQRAATEQTLNGVSFGGGLFVAVGTSGSIFSSQDGLTWVAVPSIVRREIYAVTYDGHAFVMVGANGIILSSVPKALTVPVPILLSETSYNTSVSDTNDDLTAITYGAGQFVVVGNDYNTSFSSATAQLWTQGGSGLGDDYYTGTAFGDGLYVAIDSNGGVYTSTDGSTWTHETGTQTTLNGLTFGNGIFVAVGNSGAVFTSSNAKQWAAQKTVGTHDLEAVIYDGANFVAVDDGGFIWTSANGITWASGGTEANGINQALYAITYNGSLYVAVGDGGQIVTSKTAKPSSIWTQPTNYVITDHFLDGIAWGAGQFVAVGQEGWIVTSPDGINWTANGSSTVQDLYAIQFAASQFVVVGHAGVILTVGEVPVITMQPAPASQFVDVGTSVTLQVGISGSQSPAYQWQFDSGALQNSSTVSGANTATLTLSDLALTESGSYTVIVSDPLGSVTSQVAVVTVGIPPSITVEPNGFLGKNAKKYGQNASMTVTATGTAPLTYAWQLNSQPVDNGGVVSGATTATLQFNPVARGLAGTYTVVVSNPFGTKTSSDAILDVVSETTKPSVTITSPVSNARTNKPALTGTASDAVRVERVNYWITNLDNGITTVQSGTAVLSAGSATGASNWVINFNSSLVGSNVLAVQSVNYSGSNSPVATRNFFYRVSSRLELTIDPANAGVVGGKSAVPGDAAPAVGFTTLYVGEGYTVTAKTQSALRFDYWTTNGGVIVSREPSLTFIMQPGLELEADFSTNPFVQMAGRYDGLFSPTNGHVAVGASGLVSGLVVTTNGVFSATLYIGGSKQTLNGAFDTSLEASNTISRPSAAGGPVTVTMNWALSNGIPVITGSVEVSNVTSGLYMTLPMSADSAEQSAYTMLIVPSNPTNGYGYATITNHFGALTIAGQFPNGHAFSQSVPLGQDGEFPLFVAFNQVPAGGIASTASLNDMLIGRLSLSTADAATVPNGNVLWYAVTGKTVRLGHSEPITLADEIAVQGSLWTNSASVVSNLIPANSVVAFSGGGFPEPVFANMKLTVSGTTGTLKPDAIGAIGTGTINLKTGLISISVKDHKGGVVKGTGVLVPNTDFGGGVFDANITATEQSPGTFTLEPPAQ